jgi:hypothetical protein
MYTFLKLATALIETGIHTRPNILGRILLNMDRFGNNLGPNSGAICLIQCGVDAPPSFLRDPQVRKVKVCLSSIGTRGFG